MWQSKWHSHETGATCASGAQNCRPVFWLVSSLCLIELRIEYSAYKVFRPRRHRTRSMLFLMLFAPQMSIIFAITTSKDRHYQQNVHMREVAYLSLIRIYRNVNVFSQMSFQTKSGQITPFFHACEWMNITVEFRVEQQSISNFDVPDALFSQCQLSLIFSPWYGLSHILLYLCVKFTVQLTCKVFNCCTLLCLGGEVSKHQGVLFDRRLFSSRCSDELYIAIF